MSWRIVVISNKAKLEFKENYLVCKGEEILKVHLSEISTLIIENTAIAITASLINELIKNKIKVIFCDEKRNPLCELMPYYDNYNNAYFLQEQINWDEEIKKRVWTSIVYNKILNQSKLLKKLNKLEYALLNNYLLELQLDDITNREGHAAKVYFNALFGNGFIRQNDDAVNSALNYGYAIILSCFNREIVASGFLTQIGIHHNNNFNQFNLTCDLMEPYRILIDEVVYQNIDKPFDSEFKHKLVDVLNKQVKIDGKMHFVSNAIRIYVRSVFTALISKNEKLIKHYEF